MSNKELIEQARNWAAPCEDHLVNRLANALSSAEAERDRLREALKPFAAYGEKRDAMPLKGLGESVHLIHAATPYEAEITMEHIRAARSVLSSTDNSNA